MRPLALALLATTLFAAESAEAQLPAELMVLPERERIDALEELFAGSQVSWPAGEHSLAEILDILQGVEDNDILLELGIDRDTRSTLPAFSGSWWGGVQLCCRSYRLGLVGPEPEALSDAERARRQHLQAMGQRNGEQRAVPVRSGALLLSPRARTIGTQAVDSAGLLVVVDDLSRTRLRRLSGSNERWCDVSFHLRLEPRHPHELIEGAKINWRSARADDGSELRFGDDAENDPLLQALLSNQQNASAGGAVRILGLPETCARIVLEAELELDCRSPISLRETISFGDHRAVRDGGIPFSVHLTDHHTAAQREENADALGLLVQGQENADAQTVLVIESPATLAHRRFQVQVLDAAGRQLRPHRTNTTTQQGRLLYAASFPQVGEGDYQLLIDADFTLGEVSLPLEFALDLPQ